MKNLKILANKEKFRKFLGIEIVSIGKGYAKVKLKITAEMTNIYDFTHGGVIFALADEAFELACNSRNYVEFGLNVSISYTKASVPNDTLFAEAKFISESKKISVYSVTITNDKNEVIASSQATAYKKSTYL